MSLGVPFDTYHRNDQPDSVRSAASGETPIVVAEFEAADVTLHAGDITDESVLAALADCAGAHAGHANIDIGSSGPAIQSRRQPRCTVGSSNPMTPRTRCQPRRDGV